MNEKWNIIKVLQYTRHDWLNRIQLINGNLALGKKNKWNMYMNEIVLDMQQEANLTNLRYPTLRLCYLQ